MTPFAWGCLVGWLLFVPSAVAAWLIVWWVVNLIRNPKVVLGRDAGLFNLRGHRDIARSIALMEEAGCKVKLIGGRWYWVTRAKE